MPMNELPVINFTFKGHINVRMNRKKNIKNVYLVQLFVI